MPGFSMVIEWFNCLIIFNKGWFSKMPPLFLRNSFKVRKDRKHLKGLMLLNYNDFTPACRQAGF